MKRLFIRNKKQHYITLRYMALHYITLHCIKLHYITYINHTYIHTYIRLKPLWFKEAQAGRPWELRENSNLAFDTEKGATAELA